MPSVCCVLTAWNCPLIDPSSWKNRGSLKKQESGPRVLLLPAQHTCIVRSWAGFQRTTKGPRAERRDAVDFWLHQFPLLDIDHWRTGLAAARWRVDQGGSSSRINAAAPRSRACWQENMGSLCTLQVFYYRSNCGSSSKRGIKCSTAKVWRLSRLWIGVQTDGVASWSVLLACASQAITIKQF